MWSRAVLLLSAALGLGCHTTPDVHAYGSPPSPARPAPALARAASDRPAPGAPSSGVEEMVVADIASFTPNLEVASAESASAHAADAIHREVIYSADLQVVVVSADRASRSVRSMAEAVGGYLQESDSESITVRVPAAKFDVAVDQIAALGEVVERAISASDVTEEILDLDIRLDNARKARARLLDHLARSQKIADTLKIEKELARVSETIEEIEGKLRYMRLQIAMSTISVVWAVRTPSQPGAGTALGLPFDWVEALGDGLVAGEVQPMTRRPHLFDFAPRFDPPSGFIRYFSSRTHVEALSADGLRIKVRAHPNQDHGALAFWKDLARQSLVRSRGVAFADERALGGDRVLLVGTREVGGETLAYLLLLKRTNRRIETFEAWGPKALFDQHLGELTGSAESLR